MYAELKTHENHPLPGHCRLRRRRRRCAKMTVEKKYQQLISYAIVAVAVAVAVTAVAVAGDEIWRAFSGI